jgi:hypothetical protein
MYCRPFRFWCNEDQDDNTATTPDKNAEKVPATTPDSSNGQIDPRRDLEDYTRLHLYFGGLQAGIADGTFKIGLKWKNVNGPSTPAIKVYQAAESDGGSKYLTDDSVADSQISGDYKTVKATVTGITAVMLPTSLFPNFSEQNPPVHLLFEGVSPGKAQLVVTFTNPTAPRSGKGRVCGSILSTFGRCIGKLRRLALRTIIQSLHKPAAARHRSQQWNAWKTQTGMSMMTMRRYLGRRPTKTSSLCTAGT